MIIMTMINITTSAGAFAYDLIVALDAPDLNSLGAIYEQNAEFFYLEAELHEQLGHPDEALASVERARALEPESAFYARQVERFAAAARTPGVATKAVGTEASQAPPASGHPKPVLP